MRDSPLILKVDLWTGMTFQSNRDLALKILRLRDVRPYLYYVGYWSVPPSQSQPEVEKLGPAAVEDAYVRMGRMYLIEQRERRVG